MSEWKWCEGCDHHYAEHKRVEGGWRCMVDGCDDPLFPEQTWHYFDLSDLL